MENVWIPLQNNLMLRTFIADVIYLNCKNMAFANTNQIFFAFF